MDYDGVEEFKVFTENIEKWISAVQEAGSLHWEWDATNWEGERREQRSEDELLNAKLLARTLTIVEEVERKEG